MWQRYIYGRTSCFLQGVFVMNGVVKKLFLFCNELSTVIFVIHDVNRIK
ncbi:hypothetical protein BCN_5106 [Bacillus cereus NC7401]|nr:hypothetical protein BCN_5106 [Bacillus cereus NC7401]